MADKSSETTAVIGAGVVGAAVAYALAREGRPVVLLDREEPGMGGASFGNVGHIASELVEPLPSTQLLLSLWRELFAFDGPLDVPLSRLRPLLPWASRFAVAAFRCAANTQHLAPLVKPAAPDLERWLKEMGRPELLRRHGHYEIWLNGKAPDQARAQLRKMETLGIAVMPIEAAVLEAARNAARAQRAAGLWFSDTAHVVDPLEIVRAFATAARAHGAAVQRTQVHALRPRGAGMELDTDSGTLAVETAVVCAGAWSAPLLAPFGLHVPLEAAHGYHIELPGHSPLVDAPILYSNERVLMTPMTARIRCSSYMEFSGLDATPDPRKPARLRAKVQGLGYRCDSEGTSWMGPRPVLPDYLPGIGRVPGAGRLLYAIGHQHIGLTIAVITAELIADLAAQRPPRQDLSAFDLRRFGPLRSHPPL